MFICNVDTILIFSHMHPAMPNHVYFCNHIWEPIITMNGSGAKDHCSEPPLYPEVYSPETKTTTENWPGDENMHEFFFFCSLEQTV